MGKRGIFMLISILWIGGVLIEAKESERYSEAIRDEFLAGCVITEELNNYCNCIIDKLPEQISEEQFSYLADSAYHQEQQDALAEIIIDAAEGCFEQLP